MSLSRGMAAVAALFAAFAALYWAYVIAIGMPFVAQFSYFSGSCSLICMALGLLLAARPRVVETSFGGLDRMYQLHKYLGVAALLLFIAHYATVPGAPEGDAMAASGVSVEGGPAAPASDGSAVRDEEGLPIDLFGLVAMIGFTLLIIISLNRKIPYHRWLTTHRFMGLFFAIVSIHVFLVLYDGQDIPFLSAPGMALALLLLVGLAAYAYKQFVYPRREKHSFTLAEVNRLERATEVVLKPQGRMFSFEPGQFAFITIDAAGFREAHPFTIASGAREDDLRFAIRVLGDFTRRVRDDLTAGADVDVEGPYGRFNPLEGSPKQVWIAGGIGITPFLSVVRTMSPGHGRTVQLYYCVRTAKEALFFSELEQRAASLDGVTITRLDSDAGGRISADLINDDLGGALGDWSYYCCGPKSMVEGVSDGLKKHGVPGRCIHREEFELR